MNAGLGTATLGPETVMASVTESKPSSGPAQAVRLTAVLFTDVVDSTGGTAPQTQRNYAWRDYGNRVGIWRMMEVMEKHGFRGTVALNSDVCRHYPRIIEEGNKLGWEWMGHGNNNSTLINGQSEAEERALLASGIQLYTGSRRVPAN